jgi:hypothetical protein
MNAFSKGNINVPVGDHNQIFSDKRGGGLFDDDFIKNYKQDLLKKNDEN